MHAKSINCILIKQEKPINGKSRGVDGRSVFSNETVGDGQVPGGGTSSGWHRRGAAGIAGAAAKAADRGSELAQPAYCGDPAAARGQESSAGSRLPIARTDGTCGAGSRRRLR